MTRLPNPGGDEGTWGDILNQYLLKSHAADGSLKAGVVNSGNIANGAVSEAKLDSSLQTKINTASASGVSSVNGKTGSVTLSKVDVGLGNVDNTADADKPISSATQAALDLKMDANGSFALSDLSDVDPTVDAATTGQVLKFDGSKWGPGADALGGGSGDPTMGGDLSGTASNAQIIAGAVDTPALADSAVTDAKVAAGAAIAQSKIANLTTDLAAKIDTSEKGSANGVASLDSTGKVPSSQLPAAAGTPDATTTSKGVVQLAGDLGGTAAAPTVPGLASKADDSTVAHLAGNETLTGAKDFTGGLTVSGTAVVVDSDTRLSDDRTPLDNSVTEPKISASNSPSANQVLGYDGTSLAWTTPAGGATKIDDLSDVDTSTTAPANGQTLLWNNTSSQWVPGVVTGPSGDGYIEGDGIAKVTVGPTAPTAPAVGDVWIATA